MRTRALLLAATTAAVSAIGFAGTTLHAHAGATLCNVPLITPNPFEPFTVSLDDTPGTPGSGQLRLGICVGDPSLGVDEEFFVIEGLTTAPVFVGQTTGLIGNVAVQIGYNITRNPPPVGTTLTVCLGVGGNLTCATPVRLPI